MIVLTKMRKAIIFLLIFILVLAFSQTTTAIGDGDYLPYIHKAEVPEHPKLELYGQYKTNLFPGVATYSYNIEVPKGTNGLTPQLTVSYNSQTVKQRPGILGAGWLLTQNLIYRDVNSSFSDMSDDEFKLVLNNVPYELVDLNGSYHTKTESYMKIENLSGAPNIYGTYWSVTLKDGTKYRFGYNNDSELTSNVGYNYTVKWSLDLIEDMHNNSMYYHYSENPFSGDFGAVYLDSVSYNNEKARNISFSYESSTRPDERLVYENGNKLLESRRLSDINIYANNNLVIKYSFEYTNLNAENSLSSISAIKRYGSDDSSLLHQISFGYHSDQKGYTNYTTYISEQGFSDNLHNDFGVRLIDINNDGFVDIVKSRSGNEKKAYLNNKSNGWTDAGPYYEAPMYFAVTDGEQGVDDGVRFADLNRDGLVDMIHGSTNGSIKKAYLNNGSGWSRDTTWDPPDYFISANRVIDLGYLFTDFNGDGWTDILKGYEGTEEAYLNNGSGWVDVSNNWVVPYVFTKWTKDKGVRILDLNGDGLPDIIRGDDRGEGEDPPDYIPVKKAWLNNGSGWTNYSNYDPPITFTTQGATDHGVRFTDVNGDELPDMLRGNSTGETAYINNGNGWTLSSDWESGIPFTKDGYNIGRRLADVNGDGFADIVVAFDHTSDPDSDEFFTQIKNSSSAYLLKNITNEYGGVTEIGYAASTLINNSPDGSSDLGFNIWIVGNVTRNNSLTGDFSSVTNYSYSYFGGKYDLNASEFRGFNIVNETKPDSSIVSHYFYQDDALKGKEYKTETYNASNALYSKAENYYNFTFDDFYEIFLISTLAYLYDGFSTAKATNVSYVYDNYSNVLSKNNYGDVSFTGDEKFERYSYVYNTDDWIVDKVSNYSLYDSDNSTLAKQTKYYYDDQEFGASPVKGDLTKITEWNSDGDDAITEFEYDSYGNLVLKIDPLGHKTKYTYGFRDLTYTYADRFTNALGHRTDYSYELGTGNLFWEEKNNIRKEYAYDVHGRILKEVMPYDNFELPTKEYSYGFDGSAPEIINVSLRESGGETSNTYYYYDGFANLVQLKTLIETDQAIIKNIFYDGLGRVKEEQIPYSVAFTINLSNPLVIYDKTYYTYDALDRVIKVTNPDNTEKSIEFNQWTITDYDENQNKHIYYLDAHGRIINVIEHNINYNGNYAEEIYNTSYSYDTNDNLIKIIDNEGNEFKFTYDSLGRKIKLEDPDLGTWTYAYDEAGNLIQQNDSVGNIIDMSYDSLNRIILKNSSDVNISFAYDGQYYGTLSNITMNNLMFKYTYNKRLRPIKEEVNISGSWIETGISYDSMDRIVEKRLPSDELEYLYNKQGKVESIPGYIVLSDYNAFGSVNERRYNTIPTLTTTLSYNSSNNRLTRITTGSLQNLSYTYDNVGNIISITDVANNKDYTMGYDALNRLINTTINNDIYKYEYNSIGNIKRISRPSDSKRLIYGGLAHAPSQITNLTAGAGVYSAKDLEENTKNRTIEFFLVNEENATLNNVNWSIDFGPNTVSSNIPINLSAPVMVIVQNNYSSAGSYNINISTSNDQNIFEDKFGVDAQSLSLLDNNRSLSFFEFTIKNDVVEEAINVSWNCTEGLSSTLPFNISGNSTIVIIEYNYSSPGEKEMTCSAVSDDGFGSASTDFTIKGLEIENFELYSNNTNKKRVLFNVKNYYYPLDDVYLTVSSDSDSSENLGTIPTDGFVNISKDINYTTDGEKTITINISSGNIGDVYTKQFSLEALEIVSYNLTNLNGSLRTISFNITNKWPSNMSVGWNLTYLGITNSTYLAQNESVLVSIGNNYSTEGDKVLEVKAYESNFLSTLEDRFNVYLTELLDYQILEENASSTISEIIARSNSGNQTVSWQLDTGDGIISSEEPISLNESEQVFIIIEHTYPSGYVYLTNASINSTNYQDQEQGVAVIP